VAPVGLPLDPAPMLEPSGWKSGEPIARPPDPPAELRPKIPVKLVGPVAMPPEPPDMLRPKPPTWAALAGAVPASIEAARQTDDRIVRARRFRFIELSIYMAECCRNLQAKGRGTMNRPCYSRISSAVNCVTIVTTLRASNFVSRARHDDDVGAPNVGASHVHATRVCLTCNISRTDSKT
jgi:hypothetical protein